MNGYSIVKHFSFPLSNKAIFFVSETTFLETDTTLRPIRLPPLVPVMSVKRSKSKVVPEVFDIPVTNGLVNETFEDDFKVG